MIQLMQPKTATWNRDKLLAWKACLPFLDNSRAALIHRPRSVQTVTVFKEPHIAALNWCGNGFTGRKNLLFLDSPPNGKLLCARCEQNATKAGLPSADSIVGRHVHLGKVVAVQTCCGERGDSHE